MSLGRGIILILITIAAAVVGLAVGLRWAPAEASTEAKRNEEHLQLIGQLEQQARTLEQILAELKNLQKAPGGSTFSSSQSLPQPSPEIGSDLAELARGQSNMVALLTQTLKAPEPVDRTAGLKILEIELERATQEAKMAEEKSASLVLSLQVPHEVAVMESPIDDPAAQPYWPYFEARRDRMRKQQIAETLRLKIFQEKLDAGLEATR